MSGEQSPYGAINVTVFSELLAPFGWSQKRIQDRNFPCEVCGKWKNGEYKTHGVDLLFTIECPYLRNPRGIFVDGKRYTMSSAESAPVNDWLSSAKTTVKHLDESQALFRKDLGTPPELSIDTGVVAWNCHSGWDTAKAATLQEKIEFSGSDKNPINILFYNQTHLNRIATISNFKKIHKFLEFYYVGTGDTYLSWSTVLTPEQILSNWWPLMYKDTENEQWNVAIICFDLVNKGDIRFLAPVLSHCSLTSHQTIRILLPLPKSEVLEMEALFRSTVKDRPLSSNLIFEDIPFIAYTS